LSWIPITAIAISVVLALAYVLAEWLARRVGSMEDDAESR
jgi:hypothetical protein